MKKYIDLLNVEIKPADELKNFHIYALWDQGEIVYIGQSTQLYSRLQTHKRTKDFDSFSFFECGNKQEMDIVESNLIIELEPKYNTDISNGYQSIQSFRETIRSLSERHRYNSNYYIPKIKRKLIDNGFELVYFKGKTLIPMKDVYKALGCIVGGEYGQ